MKIQSKGRLPIGPVCGAINEGDLRRRAPSVCTEFHSMLFFFFYFFFFLFFFAFGLPNFLDRAHYPVLTIRSSSNTFLSIFAEIQLVGGSLKEAALPSFDNGPMRRAINKRWPLPAISL